MSLLSESDAAKALESAGVLLRAGKSGKVRAATVPPELDGDSLDWSLFSSLEHLARFEAPGTPITDAQFAVIAALPTVAQIDLTHAANITDDSRQAFEGMSKLQMLKLTGSSVTAETIKAMRKHMIQTRIVYL